MLRAVKLIELGTVSEHDLAAYHSRDLGIRGLFDELNGERADREPIPTPSLMSLE